MTTQNKRTHFPFYRSFWEAIVCLPSASRLELYDAILSLSFNESLPELKTAAGKTHWMLIEPNLLTSLKNWKNGCQPKRSDASSQIKATPSLKNKSKIIDKEKKEVILHTPQAEVVEYFSTLYKEKYKSTYKAGKEDYIITARLLKDTPLGEIKQKIKQIMERPPEWIKDSAVTIKLFIHQYNQIVINNNLAPKNKLTINTPDDDYIEIRRS